MSETNDDVQDGTELDQRKKCIVCETPLDPRSETVRVEIDPSSDSVGFALGHACLTCGQELQEEIHEASDDYGAEHP